MKIVINQENNRVNIHWNGDITAEDVKWASLAMDQVERDLVSIIHKQDISEAKNPIPINA